MALKVWSRWRLRLSRGWKRLAGFKALSRWRPRLSRGWKWLISLAAVFIVAVVTAAAGHITDGWFSTAPSPTLTPALTQIRLVRPLNFDGSLLSPYRVSRTLTGGSCQNTLASSDPDALRCFSGDLVLDPCWQSYGPKGGVVAACLVSPGDPQVELIVGPKILTKPEVSPPRSNIPWALEIANPANPTQLLQCVVATWATGVVAGLRINWVCIPLGQIDLRDPVGYAIGNPQVAGDKPWTVFYAAASSSQAVEVTVMTVWR